MDYKKPQSTLVQGGAGIYPLTTADQVILADGSRLEKDGKIRADSAADSAKLGGKAPEYYLQPRNLLDNSDFEIAQAGYGGKHGSTVYAADRWMQGDTTERTYTYTTKNGHGALKCSTDTRIQQKLHLVDGQNYTAAFYINNTLYILNFTANGAENGSGAILVNKQSDGTYMFIVSNIPAGGIVYEPVLYIGTYTADTLPPYVPRGYAAELLECQMYYVPIKKYWQTIVTASNSSSTDVIIYTPVQMHTIKAISMNLLEANDWYAVVKQPNFLRLRSYSVTNKTPGSIVTLTDDGSYISSDL